MARNDKIALRGQLWMTVGGVNLGGPGRIELLARIAELGSITQAAKAMKMSYKAAWDAIDHMNNLARQPLVERMVGGKGGGATRLTARGERLVASFRMIEQAHRRFVDQLSDEIEMAIVGGARRSARNRLTGTLSRVQEGAVNTEVVIDLPDGGAIAAIITNESAKNLGLAVGGTATAVFKASSVIIGVAA